MKIVTGIGERECQTCRKPWTLTKREYDYFVNERKLNSPKTCQECRKIRQLRLQGIVAAPSQQDPVSETGKRAYACFTNFLYALGVFFFILIIGNFLLEKIPNGK